ncbi:hypothetical protein [Candidatus Pelagibacter communis]|uniref:hypothetical protein n=1 Tax=Pelagibacter ubique TaxID=198252 RepID=UPI00094C5220|nr:hypothetical protein [Candidatus Pelagibacter ubique]
MNNWQILLAIVIVGLTILIPIYYSYLEKSKRKKLQDKLVESRRVTEREKIRVYIDSINEKYRAKRR